MVQGSPFFPGVVARSAPSIKSWHAALQSMLGFGFAAAAPSFPFWVELYAVLARVAAVPTFSIVPAEIRLGVRRPSIQAEMVLFGRMSPFVRLNLFNHLADNKVN